MGLKDWLQSVNPGKGGQADEALSANDLIALERYDEAEMLLRRRLQRRKDDLRIRLRLADLHLKTGRGREAAAEYQSVGDAYARAGEFNKAYAIVAKLVRMVPDDPGLRTKMERLDRARRLDHRRKTVVSAAGSGVEAMKLQSHWPQLMQSFLVEELSDDRLKRLMPNLRFDSYPAEKQIIAAGERRAELLWVVEGQIAASVALKTGASTDIRLFDVGDLIGDEALLKQTPWTANYVTHGKTEALVLDRKGLESALQGEPDPRGFLDILRTQRHDAQVAAAVAKIWKSSSES